jgi:hypothetical protein
MPASELRTHQLHRGIGNVLCGPISSFLLGTWEHVPSYALSKYEAMVLFTGITMCVSCVSVFEKFMRKK